jgi:hypothetical protein
VFKFKLSLGTRFRIVVAETTSGISVTREVWTVSGISNKKDGYGNNMYLETMINGFSNYIRVLNIVDIPNTAMPAFTDYPVYFTQGNDANSISSGDIIQAWQLYANQAVVDINTLINGGYVSDEDWSVQESIQAIAEKRRDCFAIFDIPYDRTEISPITYASDWRLNYQHIESSFTAQLRAEFAVAPTLGRMLVGMRETDGVGQQLRRQFDGFVGGTCGFGHVAERVEIEAESGTTAT